MLLSILPSYYGKFFLVAFSEDYVNWVVFNYVLGDSFREFQSIREVWLCFTQSVLTLSQYITPIYVFINYLYCSFHQFSVYKHQICWSLFLSLSLSPGTVFQNEYFKCDFLHFSKSGTCKQVYTAQLTAQLIPIDFVQKVTGEYFLSPVTCDCLVFRAEVLFSYYSVFQQPFDLGVRVEIPLVCLMLWKDPVRESL